jgi:hypothetical protein
LLLASASPTIRLLVSRRGLPRKQAVSEVGKFGSESEKLVDEEKRILHNLVSLLLMQRRKTEALRCFQRLTGSGALCECSLKTNSR